MNGTLVIKSEEALIPMNSERIENNIGGLIVTDNRLRQLFDSLDSEHTGLVSIDTAKEYYRNLEHFGLELSDKDVQEAVSKWACTNTEGLTYDEFSCLVLGVAQW